MRDVLKGTLRFAQNLLDNDEISINDDHYPAEPRVGLQGHGFGLGHESVMSMSVDSHSSLGSNSRRSSQEEELAPVNHPSNASIFYVESPQSESEKSLSRHLSKDGDDDVMGRMSEQAFTADLDNTIAKIMTLTRRDEEFTSSTELKDVEANANFLE